MKKIPYKQRKQTLGCIIQVFLQTSSCSKQIRVFTALSYLSLLSSSMLPSIRFQASLWLPQDSHKPQDLSSGYKRDAYKGELHPCLNESLKKAKCIKHSFKQTRVCLVPLLQLANIVKIIDFLIYHVHSPDLSSILVSSAINFRMSGSRWRLPA